MLRGLGERSYRVREAERVEGNRRIFVLATSWLVNTRHGLPLAGTG
jgi:hypothetical protein